ncbi:MAG: sugar phosphate isomerase/epimerase family protein [Aureliella sp.]
MKVAIDLSVLRRPLKQALETAARLGATGVVFDARNDLRPSELSDTGRRQLKKMMEDLGLKVAGVRFPTRRGYDVAADLDRRIDATKEAMSFAYRLGAAVVINAVGRVTDDESHPAYQQLQSSLADLAKHGQHVGAMLACETGTEPVSRLCGLLESLEEKAIGVALNPGQLIVSDHFSEASVREAKDWTLAVIANDGVQDLSLGRGLAVPLGQGSADVPELLGALEEQRYQGWFTVGRRNAENSIQELADSVSYLRAI